MKNFYKSVVERNKDLLQGMYDEYVETENFDAGIFEDRLKKFLLNNKKAQEEIFYECVESFLEQIADGLDDDEIDVALRDLFCFHFDTDDLYMWITDFPFVNDDSIPFWDLDDDTQERYLHQKDDFSLESMIGTGGNYPDPYEERFEYKEPVYD